jgi:hypothetical protein
MLLALIVLAFQIHAVPPTLAADSARGKSLPGEAALLQAPPAESPAAPESSSLPEPRAAEPLLDLSTLPLRRNSAELLLVTGDQPSSPAQPGPLGNLDEPLPARSSYTPLPGVPENSNAAPPLPAAKAMPFHVPGRARTSMLWYALLATGHGAAAFDAWTTRRVISRGVGRERNPFLRPFAGNNGLYAATQLAPGVLDLLGKSMMRSERAWVRKIWWLPQSAGTAVSLLAGVHNLDVARHPLPGFPH